MSARFCAACGAPLARGIPPGEDRERLCCPACGRIHYENPHVDVACVLAAADGGLHLALAPLARGERIQGAALRALGAHAPAGLGEEGLALCGVLTDIPAGRVCLVFRAPGLARDAPAATGLPAWCAALLQRLPSAVEGRPPTVCTAAWDGVALRLTAVARD